jgi:hypothetical protein
MSLFIIMSKCQIYSSCFGFILRYAYNFVIVKLLCSYLSWQFLPYFNFYHTMTNNDPSSSKNSYFLFLSFLSLKTNFLSQPKLIDEIKSQDPFIKNLNTISLKNYNFSYLPVTVKSNCPRTIFIIIS